MAKARTDELPGFIALLKAEGRRGVLGLDCGPGTEGLLFVRAGIHFTGVDASEENIHAARARGLSASVATGRTLPFADAAFAAVWAVDALAGELGVVVPHAASSTAQASVAQAGRSGTSLAGQYGA